ncbi:MULTISPECIES: hypothetical protein [unclassified Erwinia]|uniref:hypothetical protein n=1 Tax=unclassified Erwinia TaxID=2622719 RepID=UPI00130467C8|nr:MULTISPECIES: hypothetical protein [unclassified Erwinia]
MRRYRRWLDPLLLTPRQFTDDFHQRVIAPQGRPGLTQIVSYLQQPLVSKGHDHD